MILYCVRNVDNMLNTLQPSLSSYSESVAVSDFGKFPFLNYQ